MKRPQIVILGAGYGGLRAVRILQRHIFVHEADIYLINKHEYHHETIWLHEASAGTLGHEQARYLIPDLIDKLKVHFIPGTVEKIDVENKKVHLQDRKISFDYAIIALGGEVETFGIEGLKEFALSITNIDTARQIKEHIEYQFATYRAEGKADDTRLTIVVGGAGFTGIEFLGELTERIPKLCQEYDIPQEKIKVICIEAMPSILPGFDRDLVAYARSFLEQRGVEFLLGTAIKKCTENGVIVSKGDIQREIKAKTVLWAAGVRGNSVIGKSGLPNHRNRIAVDSHLRVPNYPFLYAIGDSSLVIEPETERPFPATAQLAIQQGEYVANDILARIRGKTDTRPFVYQHKGTVCSLGKEDGIGVVFGKKIRGYKAAFMKKVIDNRALFLKGGLTLLLKRGKFRPY